MRDQRNEDFFRLIVERTVNELTGRVTKCHS